jgi:DNA repair protein RadC
MEKAVFETAIYDVMLVRKGCILREYAAIKSPSEAANLITKYLKGVDREHLVGLYLDASLHPLGIHTVAIGTVNSLNVHPREVYKPAILLGAVSLYVAHNHPSGNPTPSTNDIQLTPRLSAAGRILGINLLDHLIVTKQNGFVSFVQKGLIEQ